MEMSHMAPRKLLVTSCWSWYLPKGRQELVDIAAMAGSRGVLEPRWREEMRYFAKEDSGKGDTNRALQATQDAGAMTT